MTAHIINFPQTSELSEHYATAVASVAASIEAGVNQVTSVDTLSQALAVYDLNTEHKQNVAHDPLALSQPLPLKPTHASNHPYTIWQAIAAIGELFKPQAIASGAILDVLNQVGTLVETNIQKVTRYETEVQDLQSKINSEASADKWLGWGMTVMGIVFSAAMGLVIGGPFGLTAALVVGVGELAFGDQIEIGGKPLFNFILDKASDGKANLGSTSIFGYAGEGAYSALTAMGVPKGEKGKEIIEGLTQMAIGLAVGLVVGSVVTAETNAAVELETSASKSLLEDGIDEVTEDEELEPSDSESEEVSLHSGPRRPDLTNDDETEEVDNTLRRQAQQDAQRAQEVTNPGGITQNQAHAGLRGFVMGLTTGNSVAQVNTQDGNAYADLIEAMGASKSVAGWVGTGIGMGISLVTSVAGFQLGTAPGASNALFQKLFQYIPYIQTGATMLSSSAETWTDISLYRTYNEMTPIKKNLDEAEGDVQTTQLWQKSIMGMMGSTTDMVTQSTETAVAMLNQVRQTMQSIFEA